MSFSVDFAQLSRKDRSYLDLAAKVSKLSKCTNRHGCVIVAQGRVLSVANNLPRNRPQVLGPNHVSHNSTVHAEIAALRQINPATRGAVIYVARTNNSGQNLLSAPCTRCLAAIIDSGSIKRIVHT